jgi:hypothetical protein
MDTLSAESTPTAATIRRSGRISKEVPIILAGSDAAGQHFSERTRTLLLSLHGASLLCHRKLIPEQELYLTLVSDRREIEIRICGQIGQREDGYIYGVAFTDPEIDFWKVEFPPAEAAPSNVIPLTLECTGCRRHAIVQFDATEMDVYAVNDGILRYCSRCVLSTIWRISTKPAVDAPQAFYVPPAAVEQSRAEPQVVTPIAKTNRRSERRMSARCKACIRASGWAEEVVPCDDLSRGGFSFQSKRRYPMEIVIEAAVPYTPGAVGIFVPAQIMNVAELGAGELFRYGAAYMRSPKR